MSTNLSSIDEFVEGATRDQFVNAIIISRQEFHKTID
jgi:hypothetical protein